MADDTSIFIGASRKPDDSYQQPEKLDLKFGNRHGLITGATGTGKTVTLQILAEGFSNRRAGVLPPTSRATSPASRDGRGQGFPRRAGRGDRLDPYEFQEFPVIFWDLYGEKGHPVARDRLGDGAAAAVAPDEPHRSAGRRHQHRLQDRRRGRPAAARPQGLPGAAHLHGRERRRDQHAIRQCRPSLGRRDPAQAADPRAAGRREISSASRR